MCIDNINKDNFTIILCGHYFCKYCVIKYINEKNNNLECPICRDKFTLNNIYCPNISKNNENDQNNENNENNHYSSKINKLINIINSIDDKIIIITQFKNMSNKLTNILNNNNIINFNLFYENNYFKEKNKNLFNNEKNKSILIANIENILKYNFINISNIIFIDVPYIENNQDNIFNSISKKYLENYLLNNNTIKYYFLYIKNSIESYIIEKYIKNNKQI
jgi:hypothetical protein